MNLNLDIDNKTVVDVLTVIPANHKKGRKLIFYIPDSYDKNKHDFKLLVLKKEGKK